MQNIKKLLSLPSLFLTPGLIFISIYSSDALQKIFSYIWTVTNFNCVVSLPSSLSNWRGIRVYTPRIKRITSTQKHRNAHTNQKVLSNDIAGDSYSGAVMWVMCKNKLVIGKLEDTLLRTILRMRESGLSAWGKRYM